MWQEGAQDQLVDAGDLGRAGLVCGTCLDLLEALVQHAAPY